MATIIAKHVCGLRRTHNQDGSYTLAWRLWSNGRVERTNSKSKYQIYYADESVPVALIEAAAISQIQIQPGRKPEGIHWRPSANPALSARRGCRCSEIGDNKITSKARAKQRGRLGLTGE